MKKLLTNLIISQLIFFMTKAQNVTPDTNVAVYTAVNGKDSNRQKILFFNYSEQDCTIDKTWIANDDHEGFKLTNPISGLNLERGSSFSLTIYFSPASGSTGNFEADLMIASSLSDKPAQVKLKGLSVQGLEGENEPSLSSILDLFNYKIDVGWEILANHTKPELQGDEISASVFSRAQAADPVEMKPLARFSPDCKLPFGYYQPNDKTMPRLYQVGELAAAGNHHEHQTTCPKLSSGSSKFNPVIEEFGLFTYSPSHIAFSEDFLNQKFYPMQATHAVRIYPLQDSEGNKIENQFLVCFEEAKNGDYQDYVFILKNVKVVK
ncbi:MAG: hypothetical protein ACOCXH_00215 [Cyclobacteriaceae bacterium]